MEVKAKQLTLDQTLANTVMEYWKNIIVVHDDEIAGIDREIDAFGNYFFMKPENARELIGLGLEKTDPDYIRNIRERFLIFERVYEIGYDVICILEIMLRDWEQDYSLEECLHGLIKTVMTRVEKIGNPNLSFAYKSYIHYMIRMGVICKRERYGKATKFLIDPTIRAGYANFNSLVRTSPPYQFYLCKRNEDIFCSLTFYKEFISSKDYHVEMEHRIDESGSISTTMDTIFLPELA